MLFSQHFRIEKGAEEEWFDPILDHDTKLFIDPFLIFSTKHPQFQGTHKKIIDFFNRAFELAATSRGVRYSTHYRKLLDLLVFPEVSELCLGYTSTGTSGAGSGQGFSKLIAAGILQSIAAGITNVAHFEEIGLLHEGISCDRISDICANLLKEELIAYTQKICDLHKLPTRPVHTLLFNVDYLIWRPRSIQLPWNPYENKPILLVPSEFLRRLPTINPEEFWDYLWDNEGERLRNEFNFEVKSNVRKHDIIRIAQENLFLVRNYVEFVEKRFKPLAYDLRQDIAGLYQWEAQTFKYTQANPLSLGTPNTQNDFYTLIKTIVEQFRHFVEEEQGYKLLWNDRPRTSKSEEAAQLLFAGIVKHYCRANNIDVSREVETGRGPVDFKFSRGYEFQALLEVKLAKNSKFWHGIEQQVPKYLQATQISSGVYLVVYHMSKERRKIENLKNLIDSLSKRLGVNLDVVVVDATWFKPSASKI